MISFFSGTWIVSLILSNFHHLLTSHHTRLHLVYHRVHLIIFVDLLWDHRTPLAHRLLYLRQAFTTVTQVAAASQARYLVFLRQAVFLTILNILALHHARTIVI